MATANVSRLRHLQDRQDISAAAKTKILESNPAKFYRLPGF